MLDANPELGWRVRISHQSIALTDSLSMHTDASHQQDVQDILIKTARKNDPTDSDWVNNAAGLHVNHKVCTSKPAALIITLNCNKNFDSSWCFIASFFMVFLLFSLLLCLFKVWLWIG